MPILRHRTSSLMIIHIFHPHSHLSLHVPLDQDIHQEGFCKKKGKQDYSSKKRQATTRAMATDLFAIAVDADDYATTAANDVHDQVTTRTDGGEVVEEEKEEEEEDDDDEKDDDEKEKEETQSRTFQSEENFQLQRKNYSAKIYSHHHHPSRRCGLYEEFQLQVFGFDVGLNGDSKDVEGYADGKEGDVEEKEKIQLSKSQIQFLGQVIGEMYFEEEFEELLEFCGRVRRRCCCFLGRDGQKGLEERLGRWEGRCLERLGRARGEGVIGR